MQVILAFHQFKVQSKSSTNLPG